MIPFFKSVSISILALFFFLPNSLAPAFGREICTAKYEELFASFIRKDPRTLRMKAGIELEGSVSKKIGLDGVAEIIRSYLYRHDSKATITEVEPDMTKGIQYLVNYRKSNGDLKTWTVKEDHSIRTFDLPLEITSPILEDTEDFELFQKVIKGIQKAGPRVEPLSGGVHIHVDLNDAEPGEMGSIAAIFSEIEKETKKRFSTHPERSKTIADTSGELLKVIQETQFQKKSPEHLQQLISAQNRNHALNLQSYPIYGTVEFRLFNSTFNLEALDLMSDFAIKLVKGVRTKNPKLIAYLTQNEDNIQLDGISKALGLKLSQPSAKKVLEKIFLEGQQALRKNSQTSLPSFSRSSYGILLILGSAAAIQSISDQAKNILEPAP